MTFVEGDGIYLISDTGEKYLDLMSNYGVNIFGYKNKEKIQRSILPMFDFELLSPGIYKF